MNIRRKIIGGLAGLTLALSSHSQPSSWTDAELLTPEDAESKYGQTLPEFVFTDLYQVDQKNFDYNTGNLRVQVGAGDFSTGVLHLFERAISFIGLSPKETRIDSFLASNEYMEIEKVASNGALVQLGDPTEAFAVFFGGGILRNCELSGGAGVAIDPEKDFVMEYNTFNNVQSSTYPTALSFEANEPQGVQGTVKIRFNDFYGKSSDNAMKMNRRVIAGVNSGQDSGNNYFEGIGTVLDNPLDYDQDFSKNGWVVETPNKALSGLITDEQYILNNLVSNSGNGIVDVSQPLGYNPMSLRDRDGDGYTDWTERSFGSDEYDASSIPNTVGLPAQNDCGKGSALALVGLTGAYFLRRREQFEK